MYIGMNMTFYQILGVQKQAFQVKHVLHLLILPAFVLYYQQSKIKSGGEPPSGSYYPKMILKSDPIIINTCFKSNYVTTKTTSVTSHFNLP
jgi:hypothetical protein